MVWRRDWCVDADAKWMRSLPRMPADVDILLVRRQGEKGYTADFRVRRRAVQEWLQFLKQNNPSYWDIELDEEALDTLPEDGTVGHLLLSVTNEEYSASTEDGVPAPACSLRWRRRTTRRLRMRAASTCLRR